MPTLENDPPNTSEREKRIEEINLIFFRLRQKLSLRTQENHTALITHLNQYQEELVIETKYLDLKYDHPLRAARALKAAIEEHSEERVTAFKKEATDSKFYPKTRALAWGLLIALLFTALVTLVAASILFGVGAIPTGMAATWVGYCAAYTLPAVSLPIGGVFGEDKYRTYAPVVKAKKTGDEIARRLKLFKPAVAIPVDMNSIPQVPLPTAHVI